MEILYLMLAISLLLSFGFLACFFWASKKGQFSDLESPAWRAIYDENDKRKKKE